MPASGAAFSDLRTNARDEVHYRARAFGPDARALWLLVVNISAAGLMARCDTHYQPGDRLMVQLPVIGTVPAAIRWSLGGRIGCELDTPIGLAEYYELLATLTRDK